MFQFADHNENNGIAGISDHSIIAFSDANETSIDKQPLTRKRKIDKEGFIHPTTPDIPKSSIVYGLPSKSFGFEEFQSNQLSSEDEYKQNVSEDVDRDDETDSVISTETTAISDIDTADAIPHDSAQEANSTFEDVTELIREIATEARMVTMQFSKAFEGSESYEKLVITQLDTLIADALALENTLKQQKEALRQRLGFISRTLQAL